jgi:iron complex outermembrane recepter protein
VLDGGAHPRYSSAALSLFTDDCRTFFMRNPAIATISIILCLYAIPALAQRPPDEKIIVTANAYPVPFENLSRTVAVFTRQDMEQLPAHSITDILGMAASVDIRSRSPFGIQSDMSIRGSSFSQVLVLVDGVRINDSQTGHHNSDFPVQLEEVERVEVLFGAGSSIYGADGLGGIVNIITREPGQRMHASVAGGQHGFAEASVTQGYQKGPVRQTLSASMNRSSGFEYDRDFRTIAFSANTQLWQRSSLLVSYANKEFGANGFYGPAPSKEWTNQTFVSFERTFEGQSGGKESLQAYYRTHGDRFLYDIRVPEMFESRHRTHEMGLLAKAHYKIADVVSLTLGGELGGDWIDSNTLGHHSYSKASLFGETQWHIGKSAAVYPGIRFDYYSSFGASVNPSLSGSWWVLPRLRLRSSFGRAFRIPSFTELYYHDPNNQANSTLRPERSWSADAGVDFIPASNWLGSLTLFSRNERDVIDWIRSSAKEKWQSANIRDVHATGVEIGLERSWNSRAHLGLRYSRILLDAGQVQYISKYVLDYARDSWTASASFSLPLKLEHRQTAQFTRRSDGRDYLLLDGRLERRFGRFVPALDFTNLLNTRYQEVLGVNMPGRWFVLSLGIQ